MVEVVRSILLPMTPCAHHNKQSTYISTSLDTGNPLMSFQFSTHFSSEIQTKRRNSRLCLSSGWYVRCSNVTTRMILSNVASVELRPVFGEDDGLLQEKKVPGEESSSELKTPPWGNMAVEHNSVSQCSGVGRPSVASREDGIMIEDSLQFLEERDEEILSRRILNLSRSNKVKSALYLYRSMESSGLRPSLHAYNSLLSCLLRNKRLDDALKIFEFMKANSITTSHSYSLILKGIADLRGSNAALRMFEELLEQCGSKEQFDAVVYNTMITTVGRENNWLQSKRIWICMKDYGCIGTSVTYRLLVCIFVRCGQNGVAIDAYNEMLQNGLKPAEDAMQAIMGAYVKEGKGNLALNIIQDMLNSGMKPNLVTCNTLINSLGKGRKVNLAFKVYRVLKSLGHVPDAYTWNSLLRALSRGNRYADCLQLFETIQKEGTSVLNIRLYSTALMCCQKLRLWERALQLLWQIEGSDLPVSATSYKLVIRACVAARRPEVALQVYERMVRQKLIPDTSTLLSLIESCIWGSLWADVEEILNRVLPSQCIYDAAIQGLCLRGQFDSAKKLYAKMLKIGFEPDEETQALMLQNCT